MENHPVLKELIRRYPKLAVNEDAIQKAADCLISCFAGGRKLLVCGNGGSSSDADHITGELMKGFEHKRPLSESFKNSLINSGSDRGRYIAENLQQGFPVISLSAHAALLTAVANDISGDLIFAQQIAGYGQEGDVLLALSTSGNSQNIVDAILTARAKGMTVIGMTGEKGGKLKAICDILINVPEARTCYVQELHFPVYHSLCLMVERHFFDN